jgi:ice-binding like protein
MKLRGFTMLVLVLALSLAVVSARADILGTADTYAVIAQTLVSNATTFGDTVITGDLGVSPSGACTGFEPVACGSAAAGTISGAISINNGASGTALGDAETAQGALLSTVIPAPTNLTGDVLGSPGFTSLAPGIYIFSSSAQLTGSLTLAAGNNPDPIWIFEIATTLTTAADATVTVTDTTAGAGAAAAGVYWVVGTQAILGDDTAFLGNIFAGTNISFDPGAQDTCGRAFADTSVTFAGDNPAASGGMPNVVSDTCTQSTSGFNNGVLSSTGPGGTKIVVPGGTGAVPEPSTFAFVSSVLLAIVFLTFRRSARVR